MTRTQPRPLVAYDLAAEQPTARTYSSPIADAIAGRDTARVPAWFLQIVLIVLVVVVIMLWMEVRELKTEMTNRIQIQETYTQDTRERLAEHGWSIKK